VHDNDGGYHAVSGLTGHDLSWLTLPPGFCARYFGNMGNCREMRFAPSGELFVASPTTGTTSGGPQGQAAIEVLPDDNNDGFADDALVWRTGLASTQGLLFVDGGFYYQDGTRIMLEPYAPGDRAPTGTPVQAANITVYVSGGHWPKTLDIADDGTIYVTNGGDEGELCDTTRPFHGGILALDPTATGGAREIAKGLRNPIYLRCHHDGNNRCFADELARDYSTSVGGREKLLPVHAGDDWGYPCCASQDLPYTDVCLGCGSFGSDTSANSSAQCVASAQCSPLCTAIEPELAGFLIGDTPFGLDFVDNQFPAPWDHRVFIAPHGAFGTWVGARIVAVPIDPATGLPPLDAGTGKVDFLNGWDDGQHDHGRPADITVSADGRLFISNDQNGDIIWIAPIGP
jgi:glucose/arabinose dehydrogenase